MKRSAVIKFGSIPLPFPGLPGSPFPVYYLKQLLNLPARIRCLSLQGTKKLPHQPANRCPPVRSRNPDVPITGLINAQGNIPQVNYIIM